MPRLEPDEINTLIEALEVWKDIMPIEGDQSAHMINSMMSGDLDAVKLAMQAAQEKMRREKILRRESAILIQAKLIQMRDTADVNEAATFLKRGE